MWRPSKLCAIAVLAVLVVACGRDEPTRTLSIATGQQGGVYYAYGTGLAEAISAELPGTRARVLRTGASLENLHMITAGSADIAFTLADSAALAAEGAEPFDRPQPVRALARLYDNSVHLVVHRDSGIKSLQDLKGKTISRGAVGSGTELIAQRLMEVAGLDAARDLTVRRLGLGPSAEALRDGEIDAFFFSGGLPTKTISELAGDRLIRLVDLGSYAGPLARRFGDFYSPRTIPESTYGMSSSTTIGVKDYLVVREDMDEALAYELTRLLFTHQEILERAHPEALRLDVRSAVSTAPMELHPGAARYYRETRS